MVFDFFKVSKWTKVILSPFFSLLSIDIEAIILGLLRGRPLRTLLDLFWSWCKKLSWPQNGRSLWPFFDRLSKSFGSPQRSKTYLCLGIGKQEPQFRPSRCLRSIGEFITAAKKWKPFSSPTSSLSPLSLLRVSCYHLPSSSGLVKRRIAAGWRICLIALTFDEFTLYKLIGSTS